MMHFYMSNEQKNMIQDTWDYYLERILGHATTSTITRDIEATFQRLILSE
ncbi:MAG: hypothetical protein AB8E82_13165 [Aureispira sp.]